MVDGFGGHKERDIGAKSKKGRDEGMVVQIVWFEQRRYCTVKLGSESASGTWRVSTQDKRSLLVSKVL